MAEMSLPWVAVTCPTCGGLRNGDDGPPWPFHVKGRYGCECGDDPDDLVDTSAWTSEPDAEESPPGSVGETSG
jgi:hypothetical protein